MLVVTCYIISSLKLHTVKNGDEEQRYLSWKQPQVICIYITKNTVLLIQINLVLASPIMISVLKVIALYLNIPN